MADEPQAADDVAASGPILEGRDIFDWAEEADKLREREEAWKHLVRYLVDNRGFAPEAWMTGLWVDLYDEATKPLEAERTDG